MALNSTAIEELVSNLESKERFYLADRLLSTLNTSQLLSLIDQAERLIKDLKIKKEGSVLFDIRKIGNSRYAYIKRLGQDYPNLYLGLMRFEKGKTYRITHKKTDAEYRVRGLGLEQEGLKTYLKIEFLYPEEIINKYLFYDGSLEIPRLPQQIDVEKLNENIASINEQVVAPNLEQNLLDSNRYKSTITPRKDWSAIFIKKDWKVEEIENSTNNSSTTKQAKISAIPKPKTAEHTLPVEKQQLSYVLPVTKLSKEDISQKVQRLKREQATVQVSKNFVVTVEKFLQQWTKLSQIIPDNYFLELSNESQKLILRCSSDDKALVVYDRNSRILSAFSPRLLHTMLVKIVSTVATSKLVTIAQQSLAEKWLLNLQNPPLQDDTMLLAFLFNL